MTNPTYSGSFSGNGSTNTVYLEFISGGVTTGPVAGLLVNGEERLGGASTPEDIWAVQVGATYYVLTSSAYSLDTTAAGWTAQNINSSISLSDLDQLLASLVTAATVNSFTVNEASPYAVWTVTGGVGDTLTLSVSGTATSGTDYGGTPLLEYSTNGGASWSTYSTGATVPAGGSILVRTAIINDALLDGGETVVLSATPPGGSAATGTATIADDGTGTIFNADGTSNTTAAKDDDTPLPLTITVAGGTFNEGSPRAVFTVTTSAGQALSFDIQDAAPSGSTATTGLDTAAIYYSLDGGATWKTYDPGVAVTAGAVPVLVAVDITAEADGVLEGTESLKLVVNGTGTLTGSGYSTISDDGTGTVTAAIIQTTTNNTGADTGAPKDNDAPPAVSSFAVNEGSPYAVWTVTAAPSQPMTLSLSGSATGGADYGSSLEVSTDGGVTWVPYVTGVAMPVSGTLLVRAPLVQDGISDNNETLSLAAAVAGGSPVSGTATIKDDGTGVIFQGDGTIDQQAIPDDDRPVAVSSVIVDESSPYAVFSVGGSAGQVVSLALANDTSAATADAAIGTDLATQLQVLVGGTWIAYNPASPPSIPAGGELLVRVALTDDAVYEGKEIFLLQATPAGGTSVAGTATIADDGTGTIFADSTTGNPDPNALASDDRPVSVTHPVVSESSPYAVFTVSGTAGQALTLGLRNDADATSVDAALGTDLGSQLEVLVGGVWVLYAPGSSVHIPAGGDLLVRVAVTQDTRYEGAESFQLTATPSGGSLVYGTGTIVDDGTGAVFANNTTGNPDPDAVPDDDRAVSVSNPRVNEASPYAVFSVTASAGQRLVLALQNDTDPGTGDATLGTDSGTQLQIFVGGVWVDYSPATAAIVPASGELLVRVAVKEDPLYEGAEVLQLKVTSSSGNASYGTVTILDDGSGAIYPDNTTGNPDADAVPGDDRAVQISSPVVNESSPYAVFTIEGASGQVLRLELQNDSDAATADAALGTDTGSQIQVLVGGVWTAYDPARPPSIPSGGQLLARVAINEDTSYEGGENFQLVATNTSGTAAYGTATIMDDGTGSVFPNNTSGAPDANAVPGDDRAVKISSPLVNEVSPYAVFSVTGVSGQSLVLGLQNDSDPVTADAVAGTDSGTRLQLLVGGVWTDYTAGTSVVLPASGELMVRVAVKQDVTYEGAEMLQLRATTSGGAASYGTATIVDDGTGAVYPDNPTGNPDANAVLDDDRAVQVSSPEVNEDSPYAVFAIEGTAGQVLSLSLQNDADPATADAAIGTDTSASLEVLVNGVWIPYDSARPPAIPAGGPLLARVGINNDAVYEGREVLQLKVQPAGGVASYGTATILDDGRGAVYPDSITGNPDAIAVPDDDRAVTVSSPQVNEKSGFAVFTVGGAAGQSLTLTLQNDSDPTTADAKIGTDTITQLEVLVGGIWVAYDPASLPMIAASGQVLVRVALRDEGIYEGAEVLQLRVQPSGGAASYGTATILDDGTGAIFPNSAATTPDAGAVKDDDRVVTIADIEVNENSPHAVFTLKATAGQTITLSLQNDNDPMTADARPGIDSGAGLEVFVGGRWVAYDAASPPVVPAGGQLLVRVEIRDDETYEGRETLLLRAQATGGQASYAMATIRDDGAGVIFDAMGAVDASAAPDNDRVVPVYAGTLGNADRWLSVSKGDAQSKAADGAAAVEFYAVDTAQSGALPLMAWVNVLTGDYFYAPAGVAPPYACYVPVSSSPLAGVLPVGQGAFDVHLYLRADGLTQIMGQASASSLGLAAKGYQDMGAIFASAAGLGATPQSASVDVALVGTSAFNFPLSDIS